MIVLDVNIVTQVKINNYIYCSRLNRERCALSDITRSSLTFIPPWQTVLVHSPQR